MSRFSKICELVRTASCILGGALGAVACSAPAERAAVEDATTSVETQPLAGGTVTNAFGVVSFSTAGGSCTGSMIAPNAVLTAAHCFDDLNVQKQASIEVTDMKYYDPIRGPRPLFVGTANLTKHPNYDGWDGSDDVALITIPGVFADTDYHDYKRLLSYEAGEILPASQRFYGAGHYTPDLPPDGLLRTHGLTFEGATPQGIQTDNGSGIRTCRGDSGGPLNVVASPTGHPNSLEFISGVLSHSNSSFSSTCASENPALGDNSYFGRPGRFSYFPWIASTIGYTCSPQVPGANYPYRRCFSLAFVEDIDFEGMTQGEEVAIVGAIQVI